MQTTPTLSITIPTYDRPESLALTLAQLKPQLTPEIELTIIDNCSSYDVNALVVGELGSRPVRVLRNPVNVGMSANLMKCFETCSTDWLWMLSDDDTLEPDAIEKAKRFIQIYRDTAFIGFITETLGVSEPITADIEIFEGEKDFIAKLKSFANVMFISGNLFNAAKLRDQYKDGYYYADTYGPFFAVLVSHLRTNPQAKGVIVNQPLVHCGRPDRKPLERGSWDHAVVRPAVYRLTSLISDGQARARFYHLINFALPYPVMKFSTFAKFYYFASSENFQLHIHTANYLQCLSVEFGLQQRNLPLKVLMTSLVLLGTPFRPLARVLIKKRYSTAEERLQAASHH